MRMTYLRSALVGLGLVVLTAATYWQVLGCNFVNFDDIDYVISNYDLLANFNTNNWNYFWTHLVSNNWHPLTMFSLALDAHLWGHFPAGYHATSLVFHILNVLLVMLVLQQMTGSLTRSACVAALFAVHPLHVESVAWISERKDVLSTFFLLLTVAAYVQYASHPRPAWYALACLLMTLGLLSKPMLVTLPLLLLLLDVWPLKRISHRSSTSEPGRFPQRTVWQLLLEKVPLLALSFIDGIITISAQTVARKTLSNVGMAYRLPHTFAAYFWYLKKTFLPVDMIVMYPHPETNLVVSDVAIGMLTFAVITLICVRFARTRPHLIFGWAWFVIALLPVIGLIQVGAQAYADRYAYIPHIGLFVALVWEIGSWVSNHRAARILGATVFIAVIASCAVLSHAQVGYWKNSGTLWSHALEVTPDNGAAHISLGDYQVATGEFELACQHFERGLQLTTQHPVTAYCGWGIALVQLNRPAEAEQKFKECLKIAPNYPGALGELVKLLVQQHRGAEAAEYSAQYETALAQQNVHSTQDYKAEVDLGLRSIRERNLVEAKVHFERATQMAPYSAAAFNNLANVQMELQDLIGAKQNFKKALELNPDLGVAHYNLAVILEHDRDHEGARLHYAEAYRINPQDLEAKQNADRLSKPQ